MKSLKTLAMVIVICVATAGIASADDPSLYYSLHDKSQLYYYCSKDSNLGGILQYPCYSPYPYYNEVYYTGIKERLNPGDMKVMCHLNPADATTCSNMTQTTFDFSGTVTPSGTLSNFRLFIPPGTVNVGIQYYVPRDAQLAVLSRFGQPPDGSTATYSVTDIKPTPFLLSNYWSAEHPVMNADGLITPISNDSPDNNFLQSLTTTAGNTGGGWLYMKLLPYTNASIQIIKFTLTVNLDIYRAWYNKVNIISGYWDAMGNPPYISSQGGCTTFPTASITTTYNNTNQTNSPLSIQTGSSVTFADNTGSSSRTWSMVSNISGTDQAVSLSSPNSQSFIYPFTTAGTYKVSLVVKDANGCSSQLPATVTVTVSSQCTTFPTASITTTYNNTNQTNSPLSIQTGSSVTFADNTGSSSRTWSMVSNISGTDHAVSLSSPNSQSFVYPFTTAGTYKVSLVVTNAIGCSSQQAATITITVSSVPSYTLYTVNASANPAAGGTVTPVKQTVNSGDSATLIAVKNPGYTFAGWTGTGCTSTANPLTVSNVTNTMTCIASFAALTHYTITADTSMGSVSQTSAYEGESVSAIPKTGYRFVSWTGANTSTNPLTLSASTTTATTITANFQPVATFSMLSSSPGTLSASNGNSITATPNSADYSVKWTYPNGTEVPSDWVTTAPDGKSTITIPSQTAYVADFYKAPHTVTLSVEMINTTTPATPAGTFYVDGKILSVDSNGKASMEVPDDGSFIVTVIPKDGKKFSKWTKTGDAAFNSNANPLTVTNVIADMEFIPIFEDVTAGRYTVNFISGPGGSITGSASQTVFENAYFNEVIAVANCGYKFSYWQEKPADTTTPTNSLNLPNLQLVVNKNKTYTAIFVPVVSATNDGKLGLEEVIYILQVLSGVRP